MKTEFEAALERVGLVWNVRQRLDGYFSMKVYRGKRQRFEIMCGATSEAELRERANASFVRDGMVVEGKLLVA